MFFVVGIFFFSFVGILEILLILWSLLTLWSLLIYSYWVKKKGWWLLQEAYIRGFVSYRWFVGFFFFCGNFGDFFGNLKFTGFCYWVKEELRRGSYWKPIEETSFLIFGSLVFVFFCRNFFWRFFDTLKFILAFLLIYSYWVKKKVW